MYIIIGPENKYHLAAIATGQAPRFDYRLIADLNQGTVVEAYPSPSGLTGGKLARTLGSLQSNLRFAYQFVRSLPAGSVIYSTGETWGLPIGFVGRMLPQRHFKHIVFGHRVFSSNWLRLLRFLQPTLAVDSWLCVTRYQARLLRSAVANESVPVTAVAQAVDTQFWRSDLAEPIADRPTILAVGAEMRNYPLLFAAAPYIDAEIVVLAASTWMETKREALTTKPENVTLITERLTHSKLRDFYAAAELVVVPVYDTPQAAGITTIHEAMAMGKCVVATRSLGLPDSLIDNQTGVITAPKKIALANSINHLLDHPDRRQKLGQTAAQRMRHSYSLEWYATAVNQAVDSIAMDIAPILKVSTK